MSEEFELLEPEDAQRYLGTFDVPTRQRGERYYSEGRVGQFECVKPGRSYTVEVQGTEPYHVALMCDDEEGWVGGCTCPVKFDCKHIYAALKSLIAEDRAVRVQKLSAGIRSASTVAAARQRVPTPTGVFAEHVVTTLGRKLTGEEAKFVRRLKEVYERCNIRRHIIRSDFVDLGLSLGGQPWDALEIWPSFPASEEEFWQYVANAAQEHGVALPKFLADITDLAPVRERIARWRRAREVDQWRQVLDRVQLQPVDDSLRSRGEYDLRLRLSESFAELEWRQPGRDHFEPTKLPRFRDFIEQRENGEALLPPEAELLFEF